MLKGIYKVGPLFLLAMSIAFCSSFLDGYTFILVMKQVDVAISGNMDLFYQNVNTILILAFMIFPFKMISSLLRGFYIKQCNLIAKGNYIKGIFNKDLSSYNKENNAKYIASLTNDYKIIEEKLFINIYDLGSTLINFSIGVWVLTTVSIWMLVIVSIAIVLNAIFSSFASKPIAKHTKEQSDLFSNYTSYVKEAISAYHIIVSNNLKDRMADNFYKQSKAVQDKNYVIDKLLSKVYAIQNFSNLITIVFIIAIIGILVFKGTISIGLAFIAFDGLNRMMWPLTNMIEMIPKLMVIKELKAKIDKEIEYIDNEKDLYSIDTIEESINFNDVSFQYDDSETLVLDNINMTFNHGEKYLIVGPSGGGKTTFLRLLRKYFEPTDGEITIDGINLNNISKTSYFNQLSNIEQHIFVFEDTIRNNITLYKNYTDIEIENAILNSGLKEFVDNLPMGIDSMIYDNGQNISGGERSRIAIARGLLNKSKLLILDEAFASLDMDKAKMLEKNILSLEGVTVINVSHVIFEETKAYYDKVILINNHTISYI